MHASILGQAAAAASAKSMCMCGYGHIVANNQYLSIPIYPHNLEKIIIHVG